MDSLWQGKFLCGIFPVDEEHCKKWGLIVHIFFFFFVDDWKLCPKEKKKKIFGKKTFQINALIKKKKKIWKR